MTQGDVRVGDVVTHISSINTVVLFLKVTAHPDGDGRLVVATVLNLLTGRVTDAWTRVRHHTPAWPVL